MCWNRLGDPQRVRADKEAVHSGYREFASGYDFPSTLARVAAREKVNIHPFHTSLDTELVTVHPQATLALKQHLGIVAHLNDSTVRYCNGAHLALLRYELQETRACKFQHRRHCNGACLALHTAVHYRPKGNKTRYFQQRRRCNGSRLVLNRVHHGLN